VFIYHVPTVIFVLNENYSDVDCHPYRERGSSAPGKREYNTEHPVNVCRGLPDVEVVVAGLLQLVCDVHRH
jgi:hypothetical protein